MLTDEQKALRKGKIGCSSLGAILGVSKWSTPYQAWVKITERDATNWTSEAAHWGNRLERVIGDEYAERNNVVLGRDIGTVVSKRYPWLIATPDAFVYYPGDTLKSRTPAGGLEIKTVGIRGAGDWGHDDDDVPLHYLAQVYGYMACFDWAPWWDIAVLIGGQRYQQYRILRDQGFIDGLMRNAAAWHEKHIVGDVAPELTEADNASDRWPQSSVKKIMVTLDTMSAYRKLVETREKLAKLEKEEAVLKTQLQCAMQDADMITDTSGQKLVTWRTQTGTKFEVSRFETEHPTIAAQYKKKSTSRVFRVYGE